MMVQSFEYRVILSENSNYQVRSLIGAERTTTEVHPATKHLDAHAFLVQRQKPILSQVVL